MPKALDLFKRCSHWYTTREMPSGEPVYGPGGAAREVKRACGRFVGDVLANGCDHTGCPHLEPGAEGYGLVIPGVGAHEDDED